MKNFIKIFSHILIWAIILIVPMYIMSREETFDYKPYYFYIVRLSIFAALFYINYLYLIDKLLFKRKVISYIVINLILIALLISLQNLLLDLFMNNSITPDKYIPPGGKRGPHGPPQIMRYVFDYSLIVFIIGLSVAIKMTIRWYRDSIHLEKAKTVQLEADLRNLRSQLNPHFLFNTLNNIYSLIAIDQTRAQDAVHRLSNLLRYVMYDNDEKFVPIDKELEFTQNYIDLMKLRLAPSVKINVLIENKGSNDPIASLMFITLIENAFKHGINNGENSFIDISILVDPGKGVICTIENSLIQKGENMEDRNTGIGLTNLSRRLQLLYPGKYEFTVEKRTDSFYTLLKIDFTNNKQNNKTIDK